MSARKVRRKIKPEAFVGIDPGKSGAACLLVPGADLFLYDWPRTNDPLEIYHELLQWRAQYDIVFAVLERVIPRPAINKFGQAQTRGAKSMFTFGQNCGIWHCLLTILRIPYQLLAPQSWQKGLVVRSDGPDAKTRAKVAVFRMWPDNRQQFSGPKGGWKDGRADAALMAEKARRIHMGVD